MKTLIKQLFLSGLCIVCVTGETNGQSLQLVSEINPTLSAAGSGDSFSPVISRDGRYVLFTSSANNLVTNENGIAFPSAFPARLNLFLRDRDDLSTKLVSIDFDGTGVGNGDSFGIGISTNGRYVVFESSATNLVANDTNGVADVFVRDLASNTTALVSVNMDGGCADGISRSSTMTPDGRYVAFVSAANNLVSGDDNDIPDVFLRDVQAGVTTLISVGAENNFLSTSESPDISANGRYVTFFSTATNLAPGLVTTGEIYIRDVTGETTVLASAGAHSIVQSVFGTTNSISYNHTLSEDGQYLAYQASANATVSDILRPGVVLRYNLQSGSTDIVSTNALGSKSGFEADYRSIDMTPDGRFVTYLTNFAVASQQNAVCIWDAQSNSTIFASLDLGNQVPANSGCYWPQLSDDGRFVSFFSSATNLTTNTLAGGYHLFIRDLKEGVTTLIDARTNGGGPGYMPVDVSAISSSHSIAFDSFDPNLVMNDSNGSFDVFVRDFTTDQNVHLTLLPPATVTWEIISGKVYEVQFKDNLSDAEWQVVNGTASVTNGYEFFLDLTPASSQRFYRVVAH